jgi:serine/threonine protein kinase
MTKFIEILALQIVSLCDMRLLTIVLYCSRSGLWKISDFGLMSAGTTTQAKTTLSGRGKQGYRAPELLLDSQQCYNKKVDIWSLGCILYELSVGTKPFSTDWATLQFAQEKSEMTVTIIGSSGAVCENLQALICSMLKYDFRDRSSIAMIREALGGLRQEISRTVSDTPLSTIYTSLQSQDSAIPEIRNSISELRMDLAQEGMVQMRLSSDMWHQDSRKSSQGTSAVAWLSPLNFRTTHNHYVERHSAGTGQWIFRNSFFKDWLKGNTKTLWCYGIRKFPFIDAACFPIMLTVF